MTAERAGISANSLQGLQHAARSTGSSVEGFTGLVTGLNAQLAEASTNDNETTFALQGLGLSASDLIKLAPDEAIGKIADALGEVKDPGQRAALTVKLFGDEGLKASRTLALGSEGLRRYSTEAKSLNGSITTLDTAQVEKANRAFALLETAIGGAKNQLVVALAPAVSAVATSIAGFAKSGVASLGVLNSGTGLFASGLSMAADGVDALKLAFLGFQTFATKSIGLAIKALGLLSQGVDKLANGGRASGATTFLSNYASELDKVAADQSKKLNEAWLKQPPSNALKKFYDDIADASKKAEDAMKAAGEAPNAIGQGLAAGGLQQQIRQLEHDLKVEGQAIGKGGAFRQLANLKNHGATDEDLAHASHLAGRNQMKEEVSAANQETLSKSITPMEKIFGNLAKAMRLREDKQISDNDLNIAKVGAQRDFLELQQKNLGSGETRFAGAAELGSAEARSAILQAVTGGGKNDFAQQGFEVAKRQLDVLLAILRVNDKSAQVSPPTVVVDRI
jgi:hypothetical protein